MVTPKGSMSKEVETKKNLERFSTYWYAPFCCVCLGCCAAEFGISGGNYPVRRYGKRLTFDPYENGICLSKGRVTGSSLSLSYIRVNTKEWVNKIRARCVCVWGGGGNLPKNDSDWSVDCERNLNFVVFTQPNSPLYFTRKRRRMNRKRMTKWGILH